jgi:hypothetical protein
MFDPSHFNGQELDDKVEIIRYLLKCGQEVDALCDLGKSPKDLAIEVGNTIAESILTEFEANPFKVEEILAFLETEGLVHDLHYVKRVFSLEFCDVDSVTKQPIITREDKLPIPPGQKLPEGHIFPTAVKHYKAPRKEGQDAIRGLVKIKEEARVNEQRRQFLANSLEHQLRKEGKMN